METASIAENKEIVEQMSMPRVSSLKHHDKMQSIKKLFTKRFASV